MLFYVAVGAGVKTGLNLQEESGWRIQSHLCCSFLVFKGSKAPCPSQTEMSFSKKIKMERAILCNRQLLK